MSPIAAGDLFVAQRGGTHYKVLAEDLKVATGPQVPWTPADMPDTWLWLDGSDANSITTDASNKVSQWSNKGTGLAMRLGNAVQPEAGKQPTLEAINGEGAIRVPRVDGGGLYITDSSLLSRRNDVCCFAGLSRHVGDLGSVEHGVVLRAGATKFTSASPWEHEYLLAIGPNTAPSHVLAADDGADSGINADQLEGDYDFVSYRFDGTQATADEKGRFRINGSIVANKSGGTLGVNLPTLDSTLPVTIGYTASDISGWLLECLISQMILYPVAIHDANIEKLEGWYAHKYGLAGQLPVNHPYKNAPPTKPAP